MKTGEHPSEARVAGGEGRQKDCVMLKCHSSVPLPPPQKVLLEPPGSSVFASDAHPRLLLRGLQAGHTEGSGSGNGEWLAAPFLLGEGSQSGARK